MEIKSVTVVQVEEFVRFSVTARSGSNGISEIGESRYTGVLFLALFTDT